MSSSGSPAIPIRGGAPPSAVEADPSKILADRATRAGVESSADNPAIRGRKNWTVLTPEVGSIPPAPVASVAGRFVLGSLRRPGAFSPAVWASPSPLRELVGLAPVFPLHRFFGPALGGRLPPPSGSPTGQGTPVSRRRGEGDFHLSQRLLPRVSCGPGACTSVLQEGPSGATSERPPRRRVVADPAVSAVSEGAACFEAFLRVEVSDPESLLTRSEPGPSKTCFQVDYSMGLFPVGFSSAPLALPAPPRGGPGCAPTLRPVSVQPAGLLRLGGE